MWWWIVLGCHRMINCRCTSMYNLTTRISYWVKDVLVGFIIIIFSIICYTEIMSNEYIKSLLSSESIGHLWFLLTKAVMWNSDVFFIVILSESFNKNRVAADLRSNDAHVMSLPWLLLGPMTHMMHVNSIRNISDEIDFGVLDTLDMKVITP